MHAIFIFGQTKEQSV